LGNVGPPRKCAVDHKEKNSRKGLPNKASKRVGAIETILSKRTGEKKDSSTPMFKQLKGEGAGRGGTARDHTHRQNRKKNVRSKKQRVIESLLNDKKQFKKTAPFLDGKRVHMHRSIVSGVGSLCVASVWRSGGNKKKALILYKPTTTEIEGR